MAELKFDDNGIWIPDGDTFDEKVARENIEKLIEKDVPKKVFAIANEVARSPKKFSLNEMKILGKVLQKLNYTKDNRDENDKVIVKLSSGELLEACGIESHDRKTYRDIALGMYGKSVIQIETEESENTFSAFVLISRNKETGEMMFEFNPYFLPFIQELKEHYTTISVAQSAQFKSMYTYQLYMYVRSYAGYRNGMKKPLLLSTKQLKDVLGLDKEAYVSNGHFNRGYFEQKTINVAVKEINEKTQMRIEYKKLRDKEKGRILAYQISWYDPTVKEEVSFG